MDTSILKTSSERFDIPLTDRSVARMHAMQGWCVTAANGALWITQDGDPRDIVLQAGESFAFDRPKALVSALNLATAQFVRHHASQSARVAACLEALAA